MDLHLFTNNDGTSSGFIVTKKTVTLVYKDNMYSFNNTVVGKRKIEKIIGHLEKEAALVEKIKG